MRTQASEGAAPGTQHGEGASLGTQQGDGAAQPTHQAEGAAQPTHQAEGAAPPTHQAEGAALGAPGASGESALRPAPPGPPRSGRGISAAVPVLGLAVVLAWGAGFLWFTAAALRPAPPPPPADGIVVLTGGADRVREGLDLWRARRAPDLLISGVPASVSLAAILASVGLPPAIDTRGITLGREAVDTAGNARETAAWARAHQVRRLIVVTASYHMKRAMLEMARLLPDVILFADPVVPPALRGAARLGTLRLLAGEYVKYLAAGAGR